MPFPGITLIYHDLPCVLASIAAEVTLQSVVVPVRRVATGNLAQVIDGRALRHAFESLDDDGSEQVGLGAGHHRGI